MKIIAGSAKGTKLIPLKCKQIRPTENRVKEALFSILQFQIKNSNVLDLFAGSGQLALEAISRGAAFCTCVDKSTYAHKIQVENFKKAKLLNNNVKLLVCDSLQFIKKTNENFNFIFLDPPYKSNLLLKALLSAQEKLQPSGKIICEHHTKLIMPSNFYKLKLQKQHNYGRINLTIYEQKLTTN